VITATSFTADDIRYLSNLNVFKTLLNPPTDEDVLDLLHEVFR